MRANKETKLNKMSFEHLYDEVFIISNASVLTKHETKSLVFVLTEKDHKYFLYQGKTTLEKLAGALGYKTGEYGVTFDISSLGKFAPRYAILFGEIEIANSEIEEVLGKIMHEKTLFLSELDKEENKSKKVELWTTIKNKFVKN